MFRSKPKDKSGAAAASSSTSSSSSLSSSSSSSLSSSSSMKKRGSGRQVLTIAGFDGKPLIAFTMGGMGGKKNKSKGAAQADAAVSEDVASSGETICREEASSLATLHSRQVEEVDSATVSAAEMFARAEIGFPSPDCSPLKMWEPAERPEVPPIKFHPDLPDGTSGATTATMTASTSGAGASSRRNASVAIV